MAQRHNVTIEADGREYDHGTIVMDTRGVETSLELFVNLTVSSEDKFEFKEELEELIKKYAI